MRIEDVLLEYTKEFVVKWNNAEIDELNHYFKEDVLFTSPFISLLYTDNVENKIQGKKNLLQYWKDLKASGYGLKFSVKKMTRDGQTVYSEFGIDKSEQVLYAKYLYNEYGKLSELHFEYK